ncbi:MAG: DUF6599 family protein [Isosphaeraceae bacterium]
MDQQTFGGQLRRFFESDPLLALAMGAALIALATTPLAFAVLGRLGWFQARRGRVIMRPSFSSIVVGMILVMMIPAIFAALVVKSRHFDESRYEFDPNRTLSVLDQGRQFESAKYADSLYKADEAVRTEMKRLAGERKSLVDEIKKLDEAMLGMQAAARQSAPTAQAIPMVLQRLADLRESVGLDGPQQLMDFTAPPAALADLPGPIASTAPMAVTVANVPPAAPLAAPGGLAQAVIDAELAAVPEAQRSLAALLPLANPPSGWTVGNGMGSSGKAHLETFNAENLFEKINGRAESFLQYDVQGMAYTFYHPIGDDSTEAQLYIFDMKDSLKALGKYGSEKPQGVTPASIGAEGYTSAGSAFFYLGKYYVQIVTTKDDPKVAAFSMDLASQIAAKMSPKSTSIADAPKLPTTGPTTDPGALLALLPDGPDKTDPKYVAQDVFGYSFLADVFMADYQGDDVTWQGFLRPYANAEEAKAIFEKYIETAKEDGASIKTLDDSGADRMVVAANEDIGLTDILFLKGNAVGGANGATIAKPAEAFAKGFAKALPQSVPFLALEKSTETRDAKEPK